jgi:hypothetical protein
MEVSTNNMNCDTMNRLDKRPKSIDQKVDPKEGGRRRLSSNNVNGRCPSLSFNSNDPMISDDMLIDYLASILVEAFNEQKEYGTSEQTGSDILQGINEGASGRR